MDFKIKNYLPLFFFVSGIGIIIGGLYIVLETPFLSLGLILSGLVFTTTQYRLEINLKEKYFREYVWTLGFKWGEKMKYNKIQYFYITKSKKTQTYGQTYKNHYVTAGHFNGYLKIDNEEKIMIGDSSTKEWIVKRIEKLNKNLQLEIKDYS